MIISRIYRDGKDCGQIGDRMSDNKEKLPFLHQVTKKYFQLAMKKMGLCLNIIEILTEKSKPTGNYNLPPGSCYSSRNVQEFVAMMRAFKF